MLPKFHQLCNLPKSRQAHPPWFFMQISRVKTKFPFSARKAIYTSLAQSHLIWGAAITGATPISNLKKLESVQNKLIRNLCNVKYNSHTQPLYHTHNLLRAGDLLYYTQTLTAYKFRKGYLPNTLNNFLNINMNVGIALTGKIFLISMFH